MSSVEYLNSTSLDIVTVLPSDYYVVTPQDNFHPSFNDTMIDGTDISVEDFYHIFTTVLR